MALAVTLETDLEKLRDPTVGKTFKQIGPDVEMRRQADEAKDAVGEPELTPREAETIPGRRIR